MPTRNRGHFVKGQTPWNRGLTGHLSEETRRKIGAASKDRRHSSETRRKMRQAHLGKPLSPEHRAKIAAALRQHPSFGMLGKGHTLKARAKMSAANRGRPKTPEHRAALSAANKGHMSPNKGKQLSPGHCAALSASKKGSVPWNKGCPWSDEIRYKISAARRGQAGHPHSEETKAKIREAFARNCAAGVYFRSPTRLELALRRLLQGAGFEFSAPEDEQVRFGCYLVDAYVLSHKLAFEADGSFWHTRIEQRRPGYHARRDAYLVSRGALAVIRLTEDDLAPWREDVQRVVVAA